MTEKTKILFVCLGNICRSPTAHGIFEHLVKQNKLGEQFEIDSAGTSSYHAGSLPDPRSTEHAAKRGYDLTTQRSRQVLFDDFYHYDHIIAMDKHNYQNLLKIGPKEHHKKVKMMLDFGTSDIKDVPDPYHEGTVGFEKVLDLLEDACKGLLDKVKK